MSAEKLTITLPSEVVREVRRAVRRRGGTISGYVANAVSTFERRDGLRELLDDLDRELGLPSQADRDWAERVVAADGTVLYEGDPRRGRARAKGTGRSRTRRA
jgi:hypothetical protein